MVRSLQFVEVGHYSVGSFVQYSMRPSVQYSIGTYQILGCHHCGYGQTNSE